MSAPGALMEEFDDDTPVEEEKAESDKSDGENPREEKRGRRR